MLILCSLQCRCIFGERMLSTLRNVWPPSWTFKEEEGWGGKEISAKEVVVRREEGGGRGRGNTFPNPLLSVHFYRNQTWRLN